MITKKYENETDWLADRLGKVTGSRLKDLVFKRGTGKKKGYYELIAERIGLPADGENVMDRGHRLEEEAIERFETLTERAVNKDLVIWMREDNERIAVSPDGVLDETEAVEVKCLSSASHIEAYLTKEIPSEYLDQATQYFVVNDKLKKLHFCFYDPRLKVADFFVIEITRESQEGKIAEMLKYEQDVLKEIDGIVNELLTF